MVSKVPIIISVMGSLPPCKRVHFSRLRSLVKSLKRLKPFRWRRPLEAGEAPFLKGSRLGGGPLIGRDLAALGTSASLGTTSVKKK